MRERGPSPALKSKGRNRLQKTQRNMKQRTHGVHSDYPSNWPEIAKATKDAALRRCARCMHPQEGNWKAHGRAPVPCDKACLHEPNGKQRMLTTHHLDMNKGNVSWWNLAALCQVCHLQIQARVDWHQYYMLGHSHWMLPYLRGWALWQITGITVVNLKYAPFDQYIGRPTVRLRRKYPRLVLDNPWQNPVRIKGDVTRERSVAEYRPYIIEQIRPDPEKYNLTSLIGGSVGCWCKPQACHGDVLVELAAEMVMKSRGDRYAEFHSLLAA